MSNLIITPNIYKNLKWSVLPKNKIDTVNVNATINDNVPAVTVDSRNITSGTDMRGRSVTLPMSNNNGRYDHFVVSQGSGNAGLIESLYYGPFLGCGLIASMITGSYVIELQEPFVGTPTAKFTLSGSTKSFTSDDGDIFDSSFNIVTSIYSKVTDAISHIVGHKNNEGIIDDNKSYDTVNRGSLKGGLLVDYTNEVPMTPWLRKTTGNLAGSGMTVGEYAMSSYRPKAENVFTDWVRNSDGDDTYKYDDLSFASTLPNRSTIMQGPKTVNLFGSFRNTCIKIADNSIPIYCRATKLNDYSIRIDYQLPARYIYLACATARGGLIGSTKQNPTSYGWVDVIDSIAIETKVTQLNKETLDVTTGYDYENNTVTPNISSNKNPIAFNGNELITQNAKWGNENWISTMSAFILNNYNKGKHIVECDVYARWAIANKIDINTTIEFKLHDGTFINRNGITCVFEVKNIEKRFSNGEFVYNLKLLETNTV